MKNRITRTAIVEASTLLAHPSNWRDHPIAQAQALGESLARLGWVKPVIVNETTGRLIDGHLRTQEAAKAGQKIPVVFVNLTEREEAIALATLDAISEDAATDQDLLASLLEGLPEDLSGGLGALLDNLKKQAGLVEPNREPLSGGPQKVCCPRCSHSW